jgi:hypothetical protein
MCRTFPSSLTVAAVVGGYPNAPPEGPAPWGMLAAIDLHGCTAVRSQIPTASVASCRP